MTSHHTPLSDDCRRRSASLLNEALIATDMMARSRLIGQAADWHRRALIAETAQ